MSVDDVLQSACQFWCNLMSHYQSLCPKVQQQNKTHNGQFHEERDKVKK